MTRVDSGTSIEAVLSTLPDAPISTTRDRGWGGVTIDVHAAQESFHVAAPARNHHLICYCPKGTGKLLQRRAGASFQSNIVAGYSIIMPAGYDSVWEGQAAVSARLRIDPALFDDLHIAADGGRFELLNQFETRDLFIERVTTLMLEELNRASHPAQRLIHDSLSCSLLAHLWRDHNALACNSLSTKRHLDERTIRRVIEYIESRSNSQLSLAELACIAGISRFYFARAFKGSMGMTVMTYVQRARIRRAAEAICLGSMSLSAVVLEFGFADQSHFTRCFKRQTGLTPSAFAKEHRR